MKRMKACIQCNKWKALFRFSDDKSSTDGKGIVCMECEGRYLSARKNKFKNKIRIRTCVCGNNFIPRSNGQKYCSQCRDTNYYSVGRFRILERDRHRCIYCGKSSVEDTTELHIDHILPRSHGGKSVASNLVTSCRRCNVEKGSRLLDIDNMKRILAEVEKRNLDFDIEPSLTIGPQG